MLAVPVNPAIGAHIEADESDLRDTPLRNKIADMESGVAVAFVGARSDHTELFKQWRRDTLFNSDLREPVALSGNRISRDPQTREGARTAELPPCAVAGVERVRPRREPPRFVDTDDARAASCD